MHKIPIQIRFSDVDKLEHVNNSIYNQYFDVARYDYMVKSLGALIDWEKHTLVLVHTEFDYKNATHIDDKIFVETSVTRIGNRSVEMTQQIVDNNGRIKVLSKSVLSTLQPQKNESFPIPDEWRARIEEFEGKKIPK